MFNSGKQVNKMIIFTWLHVVSLLLFPFSSSSSSSPPQPHIQGVLEQCIVRLLVEGTTVTDGWGIVDTALILTWSHLANVLLYMIALQLVNFNSVISQLKNKVMTTCTTSWTSTLSTSYLSISCYMLNICLLFLVKWACFNEGAWLPDVVGPQCWLYSTWDDTAGTRPHIYSIHRNWATPTIGGGVNEQRVPVFCRQCLAHVE